MISYDANHKIMFNWTLVSLKLQNKDGECF